MSFNFLTEDNLSDKYHNAKEYTHSLTKPFQEFERIANNQPSKDRDSRYSDVTDGTTASVVRKIPKRVVQQVPTGAVTSDNDDDWLPIVAHFILIHKIIPEANLDFDFIQKCWQTIENGGKFGHQLTYTPFVNHDGYFCADLTLPYWADYFIPRGYKSGYACPYVFLRSWWQEADVDSLIKQEADLQKKAKARGEKYESTWDITALKSIKTSLSHKKSDEQTPMERARSVTSEGIEVVTAFQNGVGATFYTFCPSVGNDATGADVTIVRRKLNKDPRGKMPVDWFYFDTDGTNPLGRGLVELIGPLQNLIDTDMAMYQWNRALSLAPPIVTYDIPNKSMVYAPNAIIRGRSPQAKAEPLSIDTTAIARYPDLYGLQKSQLLNLVPSPDSSISAEVGNPGFGKTPEALRQQNAMISVDDNYVRKNFEAWFEHWAETAINVYFAERTGKEVLQLDDETAEALRDLAKEGKFNAALINEQDQLLIDFDSATPVLKFRVDASTSKLKDDASQLEALQGVLMALDKSPTLQAIVVQKYPEKVAAVFNRLVGVSSVEDPEDLTIDLDEMKADMQAQEQAAAMGQALPEDHGGANPSEAVANPQQVTDQLVSELKDMGVPDNLITEAMQMADKGYSADEILTALNGVMSHAGR